MDIRGIEVTNQLRSAIRAKLLELGVRYDEELPDYILVMVVNKKTRQQMNDDLRLFLEASTAPFVEWLHDQVLKKLQKVQIAKKKTAREFVPSVVVKQEEERKKRKNNASPCGEESTRPEKDAIAAPPPTKEEATEETEEKVDSTILREDAENSPTREETTAESVARPETTSSEDKIGEDRSRTPRKRSAEPEVANSGDKMADGRSRTTKRASEGPEAAERCEKRPKEAAKGAAEDEGREEKREETPVDASGKIDDREKSEKRLRSCVNRPKVTSVVSVKTRLGTACSPRKKFETHRSRFGQDSARNDRSDDDYSRSRDNASRNRQAKNRRSFDRAVEEKRNSRLPAEPDKRNAEKSAINVKDRLGTSNKGSSSLAARRIASDETSVRSERNTIKDRLGPLKYRARNVNRDEPSVDDRLAKNRSNDLAAVPNEEEKRAEDEEDDDRSIVKSASLKSRIIAIKRPEIVEKRGIKNCDPGGALTADDFEHDDHEAAKTLASKVIVTPRPLKPLQPTQKRATQSLLLRAVAEANRSVVKQKNPEPVLTDEKPRPKRLRATGSREIGKNLSVHLNASKRLVMEKIQVQLSTANDEENNETKQYAPNPVNEEHMGVVMSLFQRSDDNQKFLVTLNGYNNNVIMEKAVFEQEEREEEEEEELEEEEEDRTETELIEEDDLVASNEPNVASDRNNSPPIASPSIDNVENEESSEIMTTREEGMGENENHENVEATIEEAGPERKRRKLSPIVYERSRSNSPQRVAVISPITLTGKDIFEKRLVPDLVKINIDEKSRDKCRYWPNCTLGAKCAYYHPGVPCSAFPACKFGEKCAYKHPKCKFGLACTKLGCGFSHPKQQCKYHPYCTKPACQYSHPAIVSPGETTRAKFTWKRRD